jgi:uncharacterized repeat protein (TIGR03803 family)
MIQELNLHNAPKRIVLCLALVLLTGLCPPIAASESPYTSLHVYTGINDNCPRPQTEGINHKLYGTVLNFSSGGIPTAWKIAELDISDSTPRCRILYESPIRSNEGATTHMLYGKDGKLYGIHQYGGNDDFGSIYMLDISQKPAKYRLLYEFDGIHGSNPLTLIQGKNGKLYGTASYGGTFDRGTIFQLDITSGFPKLDVLYEFQGSSSPLPNGLIQANDGTFFGTTFYGGDKFGDGTIFQLDLSGSVAKFSTIHSFQNTYGSHPSGSLVLAKDGNIYGVTQYTDGMGNSGSGTLFKIDLASIPTHKLVYNIPLSSAATNPSQVILGPENKLYGLFGIGWQGWIAQFDSLTTTPKLGLLHYTGDYSNPSPLFYGGDGYLYGSFGEGGPFKHGELFRLSDNLPTVSLTSILNPVSTGQELTLSAQVFKGVNLKGVISIFESYSDCQSQISYLLSSSDQDRLLATVALTGTTASFKTRFSSGGIHYLIARYEGDSHNNLSVSNCLKVTATTPVSVDDKYTLSHIGVNPVAITKPGILNNDNDPEGGVLSVLGATATSPKIITLTKTSGEISGGKIALFGDGHFVYTPSTVEFWGTRYFTYQATDGFGNSNPARVALTIRRAPSAVNDSATTAQGREVNLNVTSNDSAYNGAKVNPSSVKINAQPKNGKVVVNSNGKITYTPNTGFGGTDTFSYTVKDSYNADSNIAVVSIHIPVAIAYNYRVIANSKANQLISFSAINGVGANDLPIGLTWRKLSRVGGIIRVAGMGTATPGWLKVNPQGAFMFVLSAPPNANTPALKQASKLGTYQFRYTETLNGVTTPPATVTIDVR